MILPSKKLKTENSLIYIGGNLLGVLNEPMTVSRLWEELKGLSAQGSPKNGLDFTYDWFVLALDLLFIVGVLELSHGRLHRRMM